MRSVREQGAVLAAAQRNTVAAALVQEAGRETDATGLVRIPFRTEGWNYWNWEHNGQQHKTHYIQEGTEGTPIVLVHGFGAHSYHWRYQFPELSKNHRVYALCMLGYGWSDKAVVEYSSEMWGTQVSDFIKQVVGEPALVVGNSIGAIATLSAAYVAPEMVKGCALLNAAGRFEAPGVTAEELAKEEADKAAQEGSLSAMMGDLFRRVAAQVIFLSTKYRIGPILKQVYVDQSKVDDSLVRSIYEPACSPGAAEAFYKISGSGGRSKLSLNALLRKMEAEGPKPVLLVWGMKDPWMQPQKARAIMELYPAAELVEIDAGHCPHDDDPAAVNAALMRWAATVA